MATLEATVTLYDSGDKIRVTHKATVTTTGPGIDRRRIEIGTGEEEHTFSTDITAGSGPGWCFVKNEDATNFVQVGVTTAVYFAKLLAGDAMLIPVEAGETSFFMKADTAACEVTIDIRER